MQHGLIAHRGELVKTLETGDGRTELRAVTGPDYGRIWDHERVSAVMKIAGSGTGDTRWKVPGTLDWSSMRHNPFVEVTKDNTTLYASDRDVFLFLVDDANPIEAGRLPNGDPDLFFRGFYQDAINLRSVITAPHQCRKERIGNQALGRSTFGPSFATTSRASKDLPFPSGFGPRCITISAVASNCSTVRTSIWLVQKGSPP